MKLTQFLGGCHCATVRFSIDIEPKAMIDCNCSICTKKGVLHVPVLDPQFTLLSGEDALVLYQFQTSAAQHWFCKHCGVHAFGRPRADPTRYTVNARCLDDFYDVFEGLPAKKFNGQMHPLDKPS